MQSFIYSMFSIILFTEVKKLQTICGPQWGNWLSNNILLMAHTNTAARNATHLPYIN